MVIQSVNKGVNGHHPSHGCMREGDIRTGATCQITTAKERPWCTRRCQHQDLTGFYGKMPNEADPAGSRELARHCSFPEEDPALGSSSRAACGWQLQAAELGGRSRAQPWDLAPVTAVTEAWSSPCSRRPRKHCWGSPTGLQGSYAGSVPILSPSLSPSCLWLYS